MSDVENPSRIINGSTDLPGTNPFALLFSGAADGGAKKTHRSGGSGYAVCVISERDVIVHVVEAGGLARRRGGRGR
ncbi:hypothetical protein, partial [Hydrogenophaga sp.]|uniref:hypothetical protein n=1 Tax=Hydrogenophaga sp. TaxID=1904254 RepID=UPI0025B9D884